MASRNRFAIDENDEYLGLTDTTVLFDNDQPENILYFLGLLNSRLLTFRFRSIGKLKSGGIYEYFWNSISRLPIRRIDFTKSKDRATHDRLVEFVEQMMATKMKEEFTTGGAAEVAQRKCAALERQIDKIVYELYGLNDAEIELVTRMRL